MLTVPKIKKLKGKRKIVMLTAYDYIMSSFLEQAGIDIVLVGDSLGMVFYGHRDTIPVTLDDVILHAKAAGRGLKKTPLIVDMPFLSYQVSAGQAKKNAGRVMKETKAVGVKLEGGREIIKQVKSLTEIGIPVMGHLGTQPQSVNAYGGYPVSGRTEAEQKKIVGDCIALEKAGVFSIVLEKVRSEAAKKAVKAVKVPVIGIGSGPFCDGQVLVTHDLLGFFEDFKPKFVKKYMNAAPQIKKAVKKFISDVKKKKYPGRKYYF